MDSDCELMLRLRDGDDLALNDLMRHWQKPLVSFLYRYVGNEAEAIDLAQETFVRVFKNRSRYSPKGKFSTWLFAIASNLARNCLRWQRRHPVVALDAEEGDAESNPVDQIPSGSDSPSEFAERQERVAAVRLEIQALPHHLKTALLLFEYEDLGHAEISNILGCSPKAVEMRLYRARMLLREKLERRNIK